MNIKLPGKGENKYKLTERFCISSAEVDFLKNIRVGALTNQLIQAAIHHAEQLGFGIEYMHRNDLVWMLSRLHLKIISTPGWNEVLDIKTWPKGINRLLYLRDFSVSDKHNKIVALCTSEWLMIQMNAKRPKLHAPEHPAFLQNLSTHAIAEAVPKLKKSDGERHNSAFEVQYTDVDLNQHLTAVRYVDWMFNTFTLEFLKCNTCCEMIVNYLHEIPAGEKVYLFKHKDESGDGYFFEFTSINGKKCYFRGWLKF